MKSEKSIGHAALVAALLLLAAIPGHVTAQTPLPPMPGMAPPGASPTPEAAAPPTPAAKSAGNAIAPDMSGMVGMPPANKPATDAPAKKEEGMGTMPGMAPAKASPKTGTSMGAMPGMGGASVKKEKGRAGMPGMGSGSSAKKKTAMAGMPGTGGGAAPPQRMSEPGVTILGPHQKWVPAPGDDRSSELLSQPMLETQMKSPPPPVEDSQIHSLVYTELLEYRSYSAGSDTFTWDIVGWIGGDLNRLWIKTEGDQNLSRGQGAQGYLQLLYGRLIAPFWDFQAGVRVNGILDPHRPAGSRTYAVLGFQGLAPGNFNVEPTLYISDRGEVSTELTLSFDLYLTQRLVLQPRLEVEASIQGDRKFDTASGVNQTDLGLRLRYEIRREFAPYVGFAWLQRYGATSGILRTIGEPIGPVAFVAGLQLWY